MRECGGDSSEMREDAGNAMRRHARPAHRAGSSLRVLHTLELAHATQPWSSGVKTNATCCAAFAVHWLREELRPTDGRTPLPLVRLAGFNVQLSRL